MWARTSCIVLTSRRLKLVKNNRIVIIESVREQSSSSESRRTPLYDLHVSHKGRMVSFAGFQLPVQYGTDGIAASHRHTREHCSLFDVSHMLQTEVHGEDRVKCFESICTTDIEGLAENSGALSLFTSDSGGILDDLIVNKTSDGYLYVVSNAGRRENDQSLMLKAQDNFKANNKDVKVQFLEPEDQALIALQGPQSGAVLQPLVNVDLSQVYFMNTRRTTVAGVDGCRVTRCGYTGEDGFEISIPGRAATSVVEHILASSVAPVHLAGLGARDTLRLEAGLCLYGNDIDETTTPVSAGLTFTIGKRRRQTKDFPGADVVLGELKDKPQYKRVGLKSEGKGPPARQGATITCDGEEVGRVTSGAPSPSLGYNIALGYIRSSHSQPGTHLAITVRDSAVPVTVSKLPFVPAKYYIKK